jgi:hypothetical protein
MSFGYRVGDCSSLATSDFVSGLALVGGALDAAGFARTPIDAGTYAFIASYSGDGAYATGLKCTTVAVTGTASPSPAPSLAPGESPAPNEGALGTLEPGASDAGLPPWLATPAPPSGTPTGSGAAPSGASIPPEPGASPAPAAGSGDTTGFLAGPLLLVLLAVLLLAVLGLAIAARARNGSRQPPAE